MVTEVLVPLDGSELAEGILALLPSFLGGRTLDLTLLRVVSGRNESGRLPSASGPPVEESRRQLEAVAARLQARGVRARFEVVESSDRAGTIVAFATMRRHRLIALATHGRAGLSRLLHGNVAEVVLRRAPCPVLLANPAGLERVRHGPRAIRQILVPLDGAAEVTERFLHLVGQLVEWHGARVVLVACVGEVNEGASAVALEWDRAETALERARAAFADARVRVLSGAAERVIVDAATAEAADLVVMATRGPSGIARWFQRSVTDDVLRRCPCPVLVQTPAPNGALRASDLDASDIAAEAPR